MSDKLDDMPATPHSYDDVMKAMSLLHKLVLKQAAAYGGKNSKYIPAQVVEGEGSLLQQVTERLASEDFKQIDEIDRLLDLAHRRCEDLSDHLKGQRDKKGMDLLGSLIGLLSKAAGASNRLVKAQQPT